MGEPTADSARRPPKTLAVIGIGKLGGAVVDHLCLRHPDVRFVLISRSRERSVKRANLSRYLAAQWRIFPEIIGEETDLLDVTRTSHLLASLKPDVVFNATTPFPWWKLDQLPEREAKLAARAGSGMWCALDALLPLRLTEAMEQSGTQAVHVNGCYPDMTNPFLADMRCAPGLGIGNISNLVPGLVLGWAAELGLEPRDVEVRIVGHHSVSLFAPSVGCPETPYDLEIRSPTGCLRFTGPDDRPFEVLRRHASRVRGLDGLGVTIGSAVTVLDELLGGAPMLHHCPGALGLPGGYPVRLQPDGQPRLDLPSGLSPDAAAAINMAAQRFDGVQDVRAGSVSATPMAREAYQEIVGTELPGSVGPGDVEPLSRDAVSRLNDRFQLALR